MQFTTETTQPSQSTSWAEMQELVFSLLGRRLHAKMVQPDSIPGSHLWDYSEGPPREDQTFYAEMEPGDAFMVLSGCYHGGSANKTEDEERLVYSTFSTRGWMRQKENQYLANDIEAIKKLPEWLQERVGYGLSRPCLGWVNLSNPMQVLHPGDGKQGHVVDDLSYCLTERSSCY